MPSPLETRLLDLGFSANDAAVYLALLQHGPCNAGPMITETGFHRNIIYTSLEHLRARKFVSEKTVRGRAQFAVTDPARLVDEFAEKATLAKDLSQELRSRLSVTPQEITVHQGNEEYFTLLSGVMKALPKGATGYVLGTGDQVFMQQTMLPMWDEYHRVARARALKIRMIGYEPQRKALEPWIKKEGIYAMRYLPANMENPSGIHVYPEAGVVLNVIYSTATQPVTAIKIKNAALAKGYLNLFENLWKMGRG